MFEVRILKGALFVAISFVLILGLVSRVLGFLKSRYKNELENIFITDNFYLDARPQLNHKLSIFI